MDINKVDLRDSDVNRLNSIVSNEADSVCRTVHKRCEILLLLSGMRPRPASVKVIAKGAGTCTNTVYNTIRLYDTEGVEGVLRIKRHPAQDMARSKVDACVREELIRLVSSLPPEGRKWWSGPLLSEALRAKRIQLSPNTVRRALKKEGISLQGK